jgi:spore coat polysaccharide biosynthesis protein SpsF (cytidylyltransferase family)/aryl-alcohol dehydrogenase-like predicted oxidoreductase
VLVTRRFVAIMQVRTSSSRLPGKALLPVAGMPAVVLAVRRAANRGAELRVATSDDRSDDQLASMLAAHGVDVRRGPLEDVLARFAAAAADLDDEDVVARLTADNLLPDGEFIDQLRAAFEAGGLDYLGTHSPLDGLPYGMSCELFRAGALRAAARNAHSAADREHVTPWIRANLRAGTWSHPAPHPCWARLRCTMDTFGDYALLARSFDAISDPVAQDWRGVIAQLADMTVLGDRARCPFSLGADGRLHSVLTLGGAQLGMAYGVANRGGKPADTELDHILGLAADAGITAIDTARAYQESEARIGAWLQAHQDGRLRVISKLDVLSGVPDDAPPAWVRDAVDASVLRSLRALRATRIDTLLLHRWEHRAKWGGAAWARLLDWQAEGTIGTLGTSLSSVDDAVAALAEPAVGHLQCPVNLLDQRWREPRWLAAVAARPDVIVHARSVLLQGLLTLPPARWPQAAGVDSAAFGAVLDRLVTQFGRRDRIDLCLAYVRGLPWVHSLVLGVENTAQLTDNLALAATPALDEVQRGAVAAALPALPAALLDPAQWKF